MNWNFRAIPLVRPDTLDWLHRNKDPNYPADDARIRAREAIEEGDIDQALCWCDNMNKIYFVLDNTQPLKFSGWYERAVVEALIGPKVNLHHIPLVALHYMLICADRTALMAAGDPVPDGESFTLYRGVSGKGAARRLRGISWTSSYDKAKWFASRFCDLEKPSVFMATVPRDAVCFCSNERNENEFVCIIPRHLKLERVWNG
jgi:hypothetical protein